MLAPVETLPITVEGTSLSAVDVISMSMHNLIASVSSYRPWWSEFLALGYIDRPVSFSSAVSRVKLNLRHFSVNYFLLTAASVTLFLIGDPTSLLTVASFAIMWLLLYFYRDHPLVLCGRHINDRVIALGLILGSLSALWFANCLQSLVLGIAASFLLCLVHAVVRNSDDLFVQEKDVVVPSSFLHWS
ncbi:PREDICTED: PRA1 family protein G1-like [Camelina sativa]|uniref:PRA1 family protein n=1 Tax=Camelina sativa TaxID=90675 RepID=A0ABM0X3M4_CAMSA|nr:PREDICTED: PRA1 family protein G1-like [Camelina sativa]